MEKITVEQYMTENKISRQTAYNRIKAGLVRAENVGTGSKRPTWRIIVERPASQPTTA